MRPRAVARRERELAFQDIELVNGGSRVVVPAREDHPRRAGVHVVLVGHVVVVLRYQGRSVLRLRSRALRRAVVDVLLVLLRPHLRLRDVPRLNRHGTRIRHGRIPLRLNPEPDRPRRAGVRVGDGLRRPRAFLASRVRDHVAGRRHRDVHLDAETPVAVRARVAVRRVADCRGMDREWHRRREFLVVPRLGNREGRRVVPRQRRLRAGRPGHRRDAGLRRRDGLGRRPPVRPVRDRRGRRPFVVRLRDLELDLYRACVVALAREDRPRRARVHVVLVGHVVVVLRDQGRRVLRLRSRVLRRAVVDVLLVLLHPDVIFRQGFRNDRDGCLVRDRIIPRRGDAEPHRLRRADVRIHDGSRRPRPCLALRVLDRVPGRRHGDVHINAVATVAVWARRPVRHVANRRGGRSQARARAQRAHGLLDFQSCWSYHFCFPFLSPLFVTAEKSGRKGSLRPPCAPSEAKPWKRSAVHHLISTSTLKNRIAARFASVTGAHAAAPSVGLP